MKVTNRQPLPHGPRLVAAYACLFRWGEQRERKRLERERNETNEPTDAVSFDAAELAVTPSQPGTVFQCDDVTITRAATGGVNLAGSSTVAASSAVVSVAAEEGDS